MRFPRVAALLLGCAVCLSAAGAPEPLSEWHNGTAKKSILQFVNTVTDAESAGYVAPADRVAVFDNDGTLWSEEPWPFPFEFVFDRIRALAADNPGWRTQQPYQAVLEGDQAWLEENYWGALRELAGAAQKGLTVEEHRRLVKAFLASARHPETGLRYTDMAYSPMLQLLEYLREHQFSIYVVSGGDTAFIRAYSEEIYGVPRANVIGSSVGLELTENGDTLSLTRRAKTEVVKVGAFKVLNIHTRTGRRPILAVGNSDGDLKMLSFPDPRQAPSLSVVIRHDDPEREFAATAGATRVLQAAEDRGWVIVSMRDDFKSVFRGKSH